VVFRASSCERFSHVPFAMVCRESSAKFFAKLLALPCVGRRHYSSTPWLPPVFLGSIRNRFERVEGAVNCSLLLWLPHRVHRLKLQEAIAHRLPPTINRAN